MCLFRFSYLSLLSDLLHKEMDIITCGFSLLKNGSFMSFVTAGLSSFYYTVTLVVILHE